MLTESNPLAIYIHWPFCLSKCPYCDFNSHVRESVDHKRWQAALLMELSHYVGQLPNHTVTSVFFGGGTPSLMEPDTVAALIHAINQHWRVADNVEITLEANPTSSEAGKFRAFRQAGVNRVSLGVQSLQQDVLHFLGRTHSAAHALHAVEMAAAVFPRYSFDLIYARPEQTAQSWRAELREALSYAGEHLSLYQLTIEPGTAFFHAHARGDLREIDEDGAASLYLLTQDIMAESGLPAYEISNHARPGCESRHNLAYWRYQDYIGIGPGAHGRLPSPAGKCATQAIRSPEKWLVQVEMQGHGMEAQTPLSLHEQIHERLLMGLRLEEGISASDFEKTAGVALARALNLTAVERLQRAGWVSYDGIVLKILGEGRLCLNAMLAEIIN